MHFGARYGLDDTAIALAAIAVFLGHLYPVFFRFKGGKGVATAAGVLLAINPVLGIATLLTWLIVAFFFRYSSLAALAAAVFAPLFDGFLFGAEHHCAGDRRDELAAGLAPSRQHREADGGAGKPHRRQEEGAKPRRRPSGIEKQARAGAACRARRLYCPDACAAHSPVSNRGSC